NTRYIVDVIELSCLPQDLAGLWVDDERAEWSTGAVAHAFVTAGDDPGDVGPLAKSASATPGAGQIYVGRSVAVYDGDDGPHIFVKHFDGTQTAADPYLVWAFGADPDYPWTADHIGTGKSYVVVTTCYNSDELTSYPTYLWELAPLPMYDPRLDTTVGGAGAHRWGDRASYAPTRNPAVIAYNIARGVYRGAEWIFGGRNLAAWRLPFAEWVAAMNACDAPVALASGGTEPAYRCGAEITVDMEPLSVLEELGRAANLRFAEVGGMLKPLVDLPGAAVLSITDEDILITEGQSYRPFAAVSETFNALSATYPEPQEKWASKDAPEYIDAVATADDGGRYLPTSLSYPAAPYADQVQRLMRMQMRDYRRQRTHQFHLPPMAYALEPLDMISWSSARNGYAAKAFLVESVQKTAGMCVGVTLREVDPADYDWSSDFELPRTVTVPANPVQTAQGIEGFAASAVMVTDARSRARVPAVRVSCASDEVGVSALRVQIRKDGEATASFDTALPYGAPHHWTLTGVAPETTYHVRGALLSDLTGAFVWSGEIAVTTGAVEITRDDLAADVQGAIDAAQARAEAAAAAANEVQGNLDAAVDTLRTEAAEALAPVAIDLAEARADLEAMRPDQRAVAARVDALGAALTSALLAVSAAQTRMADAGIYVDPATGTARIEAVGRIDDALSAVSLSLDALAGQIALRATYADVSAAVSEALLDPTQIPVIDDLTARITDVQLTLDSLAATVALSASQIEIDGIAATLGTVSTALDAALATLETVVTRSEFDAAASRLTTVEETLGAFDGARYSLMLTDAVVQGRRLDDAARASVAALVQGYAAREVTRTDIALAGQDMRALVDEDRVALATLRTELGAAIDGSAALVVQEARARATADSAQAAQISALQASVAETSAAVSGEA
ncbi:hypothetical protein ACFSM0_17765, partial [Rhodobacter lacus]